MSNAIQSTSISNSAYTVLIGFVLLILSMILTISQSYYYTLSFMIASDNPELTAKDAVEKSKELMIGKRGKLFCLQLSFIGWAILSIFTLGIGYLWLMPYIQFANIAFYKFVNGNSNSDEYVEVIEEKHSDNN